MHGNNKSMLVNNIGTKCQFDDSLKTAPERQLVIGLDFGTAFTKVVIGNSGIHYIVPFNIEGVKASLLPGIVSILKNGSCVLGKHPQSIEIETDLKIALLDNKLSEKKKILIIAFLALVLRDSRHWLMTEHRSLFKNYLLDWYMNIGLPTDTYHNSKLNETYKSIIESAWLVSVLDKPVTLSLVSNVISDKGYYQSKLKSNELLDDEKIGLFPEFAAQVASYIRSPQRKPDLHLLIDVGAGTVDITVFNVYEEDNEPVYPIFKRKVINMGSVYLMRARLPQVNDWSPFNAIPSKEELSAKYDISLEHLARIDRGFQMQIVGKIKGLLADTKKNRYRNSSRWKDGIPTFICGGGGKSQVYREIIDFIKRKPPTFNVETEYLPMPEQLEGKFVNEANYDRFSVAFGLSLDAFDIGEVRVEDDVPDDNPLNKDTENHWQENFISKDMM